jgi:Holliday junction resolvase RusA-like endonuclease
MAFIPGEVIDLQLDSDDTTGDDVDTIISQRHYVRIYGKPKAWPRPTFMSWMKKGKMFRRVVNQASPKIKTFRSSFKEQLRAQYGYNPTAFPLFKAGGVVLEVAFYRRMPNSAFQGRQRWRPFVGGRYGGDSSWADAMKPDIDNLVKFVLDALQGVVYKDDDQVVKLVSYKLIDTELPGEGKTEVSFWKVNRERDLPTNPIFKTIVL